MLEFFSENNISNFLRNEDISKVSNVKEYKYLYKIQKGKVQYVLNFSSLELLVLTGITLEKIVQNINLGNVKHKKELLQHNFIITENEDSLEISKKLSLNYFPKIKCKANNKSVKSYLIFTTTDCNARCFYCYEQGCKKEHMTIETATALVNYMKRHYEAGSELHLSWFGGEPLYNCKIIDYITSELQKANIPYRSKMTSNAYLLNEETIQKAISKWNLKSIQITLDGTKDVYNKTKNYIYNDNNAFETVVNNIKNAVNAGLRIRIRFNVSLANIDDLLQLIQDLKNYWDEETRQKLNGYAHLLFQLEESESVYTEEFINKYTLLEKNITELFMKPSGGRSSKLRLKKGCMTTNPNQLGILPNGDLCSCEHFNEEESWGSIFNDDTKPDWVVKKWSEIKHLTDDKCDTCNYYPFCYFLAHCPASRQLCNPMYINTKESAVKATINKLISKYKKSK